MLKASLEYYYHDVIRLIHNYPEVTASIYSIKVNDSNVLILIIQLFLNNLDTHIIIALISCKINIVTQ